MLLLVVFRLSKNIDFKIILKNGILKQTEAFDGSTENCRQRRRGAQAKKRGEGRYDLQKLVVAVVDNGDLGRSCLSRRSTVLSLWRKGVFFREKLPVFFPFLYIVIF